jgi:pimeloyl-ACP methyl ester carboxylesterase
MDAGFVRAEDGLRLHWRSVGAGPALVCCNGVGVSTFFWRYVVHHFRDRYRVVLWDYPGHGRSQRVPDPTAADLSVVRLARDLESVMDAAGLENVTLLGHSLGCQVIFEAMRRVSHRVNGLVPMLGTAGSALDTFFDWSGSPRLFKGLHRVIYGARSAANPLTRPLLLGPLAWEFARRLSLVDPARAKQADLQPYLEHLGQMDLRLFIDMVLETGKHDAWDVLPDIEVPVLVVAAERDKFTPMWLSEKIVKELSDAELLVLENASHAALIEQPERINSELERFLGRLV